MIHYYTSLFIFTVNVAVMATSFSSTFASSNPKDHKSLLDFDLSGMKLTNLTFGMKDLADRQAAIAAKLSFNKKELPEDIIKGAEFANIAQATASMKARLHESADAGFSCMSFPPAYSPFLFCSGVVDYSFIVPTGYTIADLDKQASAIANYYPPSILSSKCLSGVKRNLCASVFMPCVDKSK